MANWLRLAERFGEDFGLGAADGGLCRAGHAQKDVVSMLFGRDSRTAGITTNGIKGR